MSEPTDEQVAVTISLANILAGGPKAWEQLPSHAVTDETLGGWVAIGLRAGAPILETSVITDLENAAIAVAHYRAAKMREWALVNDRPDLSIPPIVQMRAFG